MSSATTAKQYTEVTLLRPEEGPQTFTLPEGATLADLLREAGADVRSPNMLIDGRPIEEVRALEVRHDDRDRPRAASGALEAHLAGQRWHGSRYARIQSDDRGGASDP